MKHKVFLKTLLIVLCLGLGIRSAFPQTSTLEILSKSTLKPVERVAVFLPNGSFSAISDERGRISPPELTATDTLIFRHPAYYAEKVTLRELTLAGFRIYLTDKIVFMEEFVVGVSKSEEPAGTIPNKVETLQKRDVIFSDAPSAGAMLQRSGNLFMQTTVPGGFTPVMRGFSSNKVLLVLDGVRINTAIFNTDQTPWLSMIDAQVLEKTEIIYGPGSLIYGSDALGGVIHFFSKELKFNSQGGTKGAGEGMVRFASANREKTVHAGTELKGKNWASFTGITFSDFEDLNSGRNRSPLLVDFGKRFYFVAEKEGRDIMAVNEKPHIQRPTDYQQLNLTQKFKVKTGSKSQLEGSLFFVQTGEVPVYGRLNLFDTVPERLVLEQHVFQDTILETDTILWKPRLTHARYHYHPDVWFLGTLKYSVEKAEGFFNSLQITGSFQSAREHREMRRFLSPQIFSRTEKVNMLTLNADLRKDVSERVSLFYGLELIHNSVSSTASGWDSVLEKDLAAVTRYPGQGSAMQLYSGYLKYNLRLSQKVSLSQGFRFSSNRLVGKFSDRALIGLEGVESARTQSAFSGSSGLTITPGKDFQINAILSSGYRNPNIDDAFKTADPAEGLAIVPNLNLRPEYAYNLEAGLQKRFSERINIGFVFFNSFLRQTILRQQVPYNFSDSVQIDGTAHLVYANSNIGRGVIRGFTFEMAADITRNFKLESSLNYTYGQNHTFETPMPGIPPVFGRSALIYFYEKLRGELSIFYSGWKHTDRYAPTGEDFAEYAIAEGTPAYYLLNLRLGYQVNKNLRIQAACDNLLDVHYRPFASGISGPGRNFVFSVRAGF